jgi:hypothetical protein
MMALARGRPAICASVRRATMACSVALVLCVTVTPSAAQNLSIRDVPLKPWTGFARSWDWTYDALHKLVLSGLAGRVVLNTKPMSRREMALIVGDIVRRIQNNQVMGYDDRLDLQDILLDLMSEFNPELRALGLTGYGLKGEPPRLVEVKPIEYLQFRAGFTSNSAANLENSNGERLDIGLNGRVTSSSWFEAGGIVAGYVQPEYEIGSGTNRGQVIEGYVKGRAGFAELVVGREPLWWGPGFHGSMLVSNNALALDMVRLRTANQVTLPWVFADIFGPLKFELFVGQLEEERTYYPRSQVMGTRIDFSPLPWLEIGLARTLVFDGDGRPKPRWYELPRVWFFGNEEGSEGSKYAGDNRFQLDVSLRLANVGKYVFITRDAEVYLDLGWDDTCCGTFFWPIKPSPIVGVYLPNLFGSPDTTFRFEYSNSSAFQFTHGVWQDGYTRKGQVISHFEGTVGEDWFVRLTQRLNPQLDVGIEFDWARIGRTEKGLEFATKELRRYVGADISYRHSSTLSLIFAGRLEWTNNLDFVPGRREFNQVYTAAVTYTFESTIGMGKRTTASPD